MPPIIEIEENDPKPMIGQIDRKLTKFLAIHDDEKLLEHLKEMNRKVDMILALLKGI